MRGNRKSNCSVTDSVPQFCLETNGRVSSPQDCPAPRGLHQSQPASCAWSRVWVNTSTPCHSETTTGTDSFSRITIQVWLCDLVPPALCREIGVVGTIYSKKRKTVDLYCAFCETSKDVFRISSLEYSCYSTRTTETRKNEYSLQKYLRRLLAP